MPPSDAIPIIRILPEALANQIAAGEVVERPASVVKELIENSLDADASQIDLDIEQGGTRLIRIQDNGHGIPQAQLPLAVSRHATSKLESADDLQAIQSLGFRGEALASIGSVARLQVISRSNDDEQAWRLSVAASRETPLEPAAHPVGTTLEVSDLFYNTPARRKFLRAERTEFRHLDDVVRRMALAEFDVGFSLRHNGRVVHRLHAAQDDSSRQRRLQQLFGKAFTEQSMQVDVSASGLRLWGWLSQSGYSRSTADLQFFYVNGRTIRDRVIGHALRQAFQQVLPPGRYPAYVLHLELDPAQVDVNVHPTKHEVRFRESRWVHDFIYRVVSDALARTPQSSLTKPEPHPYSGSATAPAIDGVSEPLAAYQLLSGVTAPADGDEPVQTALGRYVGRVQGRYVLLEQEQGLCLLDIQRAREQLLYQALLLAQEQGEWRQQPVLVPELFSTSAPQLQAVEQHHDLLTQMGFEFRISGPGTLMLLHLPSLFKGVAIRPLVEMLFETLVAANGEFDSTALFAALARCVVQHTKVPETKADIVQLVEQLHTLPSGADSVWRLLPGQRLDELIRRG